MKSSRTILVMTFCIFFSPALFSQEWKQFLDSANTYNAKNNLDKTIEFYGKAREELKKDSAETITYANVCDSLGFTLFTGKKFKEALPYYLEVKVIKEKVAGKSSPDYASICNDLATVFYFLEEFDNSEPLYLETRELQEKLSGKNSPEYASACINLASLYRETGQYQKAVPFYLEAKQIRENILGKLNADYAITCGDLGTIYFYLGLFSKAEPLVLEAKEIQEKVAGKEDQDYIAYLNNLAQIYEIMGQYEKAEPLYLDSRKTAATILGSQDPQYALYCNNLAQLYNLMGKYDKAEVLYLETKEVYERTVGKEHTKYAQSCNNLAKLYKDMGQYEKAESLFLDAKNIFEKKLGPQHPLYAGACSNLAMVYQEKGEFVKAVSLLAEVMQIREKSVGKEHPDYAYACQNLGIVFKKMGEYGKAEALFLQAIDIQEKKLGKMNARYAEFCNSLAKLYTETDQYAKAAAFFQEAKDIREKTLGDHHKEYGASCRNLANVYWLIHQPAKAETQFRESFAVNAYNLNTVFKITNEKEKVAYIKNVAGEANVVFSFYSSRKLSADHPYTLSLFHRNLILSASQALQKQLFYSTDTMLVGKYNEWTDLKKYLAVLYTKPVAERKENMAGLEDKAGELEKELTRLSAGFRKQQQQTGWKDIQNTLKATEAAVEFVEFRYNNGKHNTDSIYYIALVLRKDKPLPTLVHLFEKKQLDSLLANTGNKTTNDGAKNLYASRGIIIEDRNIASTSRSVYAVVWKPMEKELRDIKTVYFAPAGLLHRIAFAALPLNKTEVLSDRYKLVQLASTATVTDLAPAFITKIDNVQLYGAINYDTDSLALKKSAASYASNIHHENMRSLPGDLLKTGSFNYLTGTEAEINIIGEAAKNTQPHVSVLSGHLATEESFKALNGKASPAVIHIATHGFFFPDPKTVNTDNQSGTEAAGQVFRQSDNPLFRSGLLFAGANNAWNGKPVEGIEDGILTAYDVSNMYLPNTKLAVLSACETALGDIQGSEGVYGLQRAFKIAGVQNLVMSLWKVPDAETAEFMQLFYKNMFAKQSISDAFYHAQASMKNKYRAEPYKWAAWILVR